MLMEIAHYFNNALKSCYENTFWLEKREDLKRPLYHDIKIKYN